MSKEPDTNQLPKDTIHYLFSCNSNIVKKKIKCFLKIEIMNRSNLPTKSTQHFRRLRILRSPRNKQLDFHQRISITSSQYHTNF